MENFLSWGLLFVLGIFGRASVLAEAPVPNYVANFYDPYPINTYGAHPFHLHRQSAESSSHQEDENVSRSTEKSSEQRSKRQPKRIFGFSRRPKPPHRKDSGEGYLSPPKIAQDTPPVPSPYARSFSMSPTSSPYDNTFSHISPNGYSPYQGYQPEGWFNTMKGGYDDYGYNYDKLNSNSPPYPGPRQNMMDAAYSAPSLSEHDNSASLPPIPSGYAFSAGGEPEFISYSEGKEQPFSSAQDSKRPPSNGYGEEPYFTFGPKKKPQPPHNSVEDHSDQDHHPPKKSDFYKHGKPYNKRPPATYPEESDHVHHGNARSFVLNNPLRSYWHPPQYFESPSHQPSYETVTPDEFSYEDKKPKNGKKEGKMNQDKETWDDDYIYSHLNQDDDNDDDNHKKLVKGNKKSHNDKHKHHQGHRSRARQHRQSSTEHHDKHHRTQSHPQHHHGRNTKPVSSIAPRSSGPKSLIPIRLWRRLRRNNSNNNKHSSVRRN